ncbi:unnamed protein product [Rotaria sp. Silwood2]|nr:unnamed protein product [Rotaria sp. Silwood2]CAF2794432.1 unnamed protein product [Rotaria sp. Silwood2]CAF2820244.1 unnamed protein product [Rotaria sp. Silwood2]CAF2922946.1 unnamed protein product [Rotaria sp. Silwood2]
MPISSGFSQDPNINYYVRRPGKTELLDEAIYYKRDEPFERPVEETVFMPDRKPPPLASTRDMYAVSPEPRPTIYTTTSNAAPSTSFNLIRALGLNADCPCWAWLCIVFSFILLLGLIGMCLYFILEREGYI